MNAGLEKNKHTYENVLFVIRQETFGVTEVLVGPKAW